MSSFNKKLLAIVALIGLTTSTFSLSINHNQAQASIIPTPIAQFQTSLASSISANDTTMFLAAATDKEGNALASSTYGFIIDEGTGSDEFVLANCTGTSCTGMTRGISVISGTSSITSLKKAHRRGASVKITDTPLLLILARQANGQDTYPNKLTYQSNPSLTSALDLANRGYVDTYGASTTLYASTSFARLAGSNTITANNALSGTNSFTGSNTFSLSPTIPNPSANTDAASKQYVDGVVTGGAPVSNNTTTGILRTATSTQYSKGFSSTTPYALTSAFASSTASTSSSIIVATQAANGKVSNTFFDTSAAYTLAGLTNTGTSTLATTTVSGRNVDSFGFNTVQITSSSTWSVPAGVHYVRVRMVGAGGGGGASFSGNEIGGAGGSGGYCEKVVDVSATTSISVTLGIGGALGSGTSGGSTGGNSTFSSFATAFGGNGGGYISAGGTGATQTGCDVNINGMTGQDGNSGGSTPRIASLGGASALSSAGNGGKTGSRGIDGTVIITY